MLYREDVKTNDSSGIFIDKKEKRKKESYRNNYFLEGDHSKSEQHKSNL